MKSRWGLVKKVLQLISGARCCDQYATIISLPSSESSFPAEGVRKQNWNALNLCLSVWVCPQMTSFLSTQIHEKRQIENFDYKIKPFLC